MKKLFIFFAFLFLIGINAGANAQLTGIRTIPGNYATIAAAVADLNVQGVGTGGVTFNVSAGHDETSSNIVINIVTNNPTASNQVIFQRFGAGPNPLITAAPGASPSFDGIVKIFGADYITFDRIDLLDPASNTGDAQMEWGYAILRKDTADGSQHNTIKGCTITLQKINTASVGVAILNRTADGTVQNTVIPSGHNSFNRIFGNVIGNVYKGIVLISASTVGQKDDDNEVGVNGESSNLISNWGGSTVSAEGIRCEGQSNVKINNNVVNGGAGTSGSAATVGIIATLFGSLPNAENYEISHNTVTINGSTSSQAHFGIRALANGDTVKIHHNIVENCIAPQSTTGFNGIAHDAVGNVNAAYIYENIVRNNSHAGTGTCTLLSGATSDTVGYMRIYKNQVYGNQKTGISGTMNCITAATSTLLECDSNYVYNNTIAGSSGTGAATIYGYINSGDPTMEKVFDNNIRSLFVGGSNTSTSSIVAGIRSNVGALSSKEIYRNIIDSLSGISGSFTTGGVVGVWSTAGTSTKIHSNKISNLTNNRANGTAGGCWVTSGTTIEIYNNIISDIKAPTSTNANGVIGINSTSTAVNSTIDIHDNSIYLTASGGTTFGSSGISVAGNATATTAAVTMQNNNIVNISTPGSTSGNTVAYRRSNVNLANYGAGSDFNNFYAGNPLAGARLIFFDGTNSDATLAAYQLRVAPRDANSTSQQLKILNLSINLEACEDIDTITVEARSTTSPYPLVESVVGLGGLGLKQVFSFGSLTDGVSYYLVVRHRNSIETWSKSGGELFVNGVLNYDFTSAASKAFGNNMINVGGEWSFYTGDVTQNGVVDGADAALIDNDAFNFVAGYVATDLNCDEIVDGEDAAYADNNVFNFVQTIRP